MKTALLLFLSFLSWVASAAVVSREEAVETARGFSAYVGGTVLEGSFAGALEEPFAVEADLDGTSTILAYGFNFTGSGWILVAADDRIDPIAGFSPVGRIAKADFEDPDSPSRTFVTEALLASFRALEAFERTPAPVASAAGAGNEDGLRSAVDAKIASAKAKRAKYRAALPVVREGVPVPPAVSSVPDLRVATLMQTQWSQNDHGEDYYTKTFYPNAPSGCTQTAFGQIFYYLHWPVSARGKFRIANGDIFNSAGTKVAGTSCVRKDSTAYRDDLYTKGGDENGGAYRWDLMYKNGTSASLTEPQRKALGALMWDIAIVNGAEFHATTTGALPHPSALMAVFGYANMRCTDVSGDGWSGPRGTQTPEQEAAWYNAVHANLDAKIPVYMSGSSATGAHATVADGYGYIDSDPYYHVNFGWGGTDGYYRWNDWGGYTTELVVFNIFTNFTGEIVSGRVTYPDGSAAANVPVTLTYQSGGTRSVTAKTDAHGVWAAVGVPSATTYTVTPSLSGYSFAPRTVSTGTSRYTSTSEGTSCGNVSRVDFTAESTARAIVTGTVKLNGAPFAGATVRFGALSTTTSALGQYGFEVAPGTKGTLFVPGYPNVSPDWVDVASTAPGQTYKYDFNVAVSLAEALDEPMLVFQTGTDLPWTVAADQACTTLSAVSAAIGSRDKVSWLQVSLTGPGTLSFKALPMAFGGMASWGFGDEASGLSYWLDSGEKKTIYGYDGDDITILGPDPSGWKTYTVSIPKGNHVMHWELGPFDLLLGGLDNKAWIDAISWKPDTSSVVLPDHVGFTTDGTAFSLSGTSFSLNVANPVKGATYTVLTNATLTGHFAPAFSQMVNADLSVLPIKVPVDPTQATLFAKVVATIGPYEEE